LTVFTVINPVYRNYYYQIFILCYWLV